MINTDELEKNIYTDIRIVEGSKNYEKVYEQLLSEIKHIKTKKISIGDTNSLKEYINEEVRNNIFSEKGLPTYLVRIIILLGKEYEDHVSEKVKSYLITQYSTEFHQYLNKEFISLNPLKNCYLKIEKAIGKIRNIYFNLPKEWNIEIEIIKIMYFSLKQKICDYFYFNNFSKDEYINSVDAVLVHEKSISKHFEFTSEEKEYKFMIFKMYTPFIAVYYQDVFSKSLDLNFNIKNSEIKIFRNFLLFFKEFENVFRKIEYFNSVDAIKSLLQVLSKNLLILLCKLDQDIYDNVEPLVLRIENNNFNIKINTKYVCRNIFIMLNTLSYINEVMSDLSTTLDQKINFTSLDATIISKLNLLEGKYSYVLEKYVVFCFLNVDFQKVKDLSKTLIRIIEKHFDLQKNEDLFDDVKISLLETLVIHFLSRIYILDFDEVQAELLIVEISEVKTYLERFVSPVPLIQVLESYLKIFLCPTKDSEIFIENFILLSDGVFSFNQVLCSLKNKENIYKLEEIYHSRDKLKYKD